MGREHIDIDLIIARANDEAIVGNDRFRLCRNICIICMVVGVGYCRAIGRRVDRALHGPVVVKDQSRLRGKGSETDEDRYG